MISTLPDAPLDIIGDVHGEHSALQALLAHLGYDDDGEHAEGRRLVFVGDLVDRGPDSLGIVRRVKRFVDAGVAQATLGNHELNLLRDARKEGNDWFFAEGSERDRKYGDVAVASDEDRMEVLSFLATLPAVLERSDLRIVHAAWDSEAVQRVREASAGGLSLLEAFHEHERRARERLKDDNLLQRSAQEKAEWAAALKDPQASVPLLHAIAESGEISQMANPLRVLTSGLERKASAPFWASGKWRMVQRVAWWNEYHDDTPVVVGHYWRRHGVVDRAALGKGDEDLFASIPATAWHGTRRNVFCLDYSVGGRYRERLDGHVGPSKFRLAAMRWPERELVFDDGQRHGTAADH